MTFRLLLASALLLGATPAMARPKCGAFTIAMIPDTQNYLDYGHQKSAGYPVDGIELFFTQMRWIAAHAKSAGGDIVFATHLGDVWQHYSAWMDPAHAARGFGNMPNSGSSEVAEGPRKETHDFEVPNAVAGYRLLKGKLPFSVVPGNHDFDALWTDPAHPPQPGGKGRDKTGIRHLGGLQGFASAFSPDSEFFKGQPWYVGGHDGGGDSAQVFTAGACRFLHIGLQYQAPDASLAWASDIISRFPGMPTIVTTHDYLGRDGKRDVSSNPDNSILDPQDNNAEMIWDEFIRRHDQIFLVLSGHIGGQGYSVDRNDAGHQVHQMMADYQGRWQVAKDLGWTDSSATLGDGWMRLLTFRLDGATPNVRVRTWSTYYGKFSTELPGYASWYKAHDGMAGLSDAEYLKRDDFSFDLPDYRARFGDK
jgi:hypothetical protein